MNSGVPHSERELSLGDGPNGDILFKINSILHNKLDLGDFFGPDGNNNTVASSGTSSGHSPSSQVNGHPLSPRSPGSRFPSNGGASLFPRSNCEKLESASNGLHGSFGAVKSSGQSRMLSGSSHLDMGFLGGSGGGGSSSEEKLGFHRFQEPLGIPPVGSGSNATHHPFPRTSRKVGDFRFLDMGPPSSSSPLKLPSRNSYEDSMMTSSPNALGSRFRLGGESSSLGILPSSSLTTNHFNFNTSSAAAINSGANSSPPFDDSTLLMGGGDKWGDIGEGGSERTTATSPGSDGAYGSSLNSMGGALRVSQQQQHQDDNPHHDSGISDIFKSLGLNESVMGYNSSSSPALDSPNVHHGSNSYFSRSSVIEPPSPTDSNLQGGIHALYTCGSSKDPPGSLERAARIHRNGTAIYDASCTWHGSFPVRKDKNIQLSVKVFLGGVPWDITEAALLSTFKPFGPIKIEWPGKDNSSVPRGYLYIIFENEKQVKDLLNACTHDYGNGGSWYFKISSRRMRNKEVQVIPWIISDSNFVRCPSQRLDPKKTVFVGALHGMLTAEGLGSIFNDLFGGVVYAGVDTDKYKYPQGSGRVTFSNHRSYMKAVSAAFIEIKAPKFTKKVQVDPYLEDELCSNCDIRQGPYFCRDQVCFKYFCRYCWELLHGSDLAHHSPLMRNSSKPNGGVNLGGGVPRTSSPSTPPSPFSE